LSQLFCGAHPFGHISACKVHAVLWSYALHKADAATKTRHVATMVCELSDTRQVSCGCEQMGLSVVCIWPSFYENAVLREMAELFHQQRLQEVPNIYWTLWARQDTELQHVVKLVPVKKKSTTSCMHLESNLMSLPDGWVEVQHNNMHDRHCMLRPTEGIESIHEQYQRHIQLALEEALADQCLVCVAVKDIPVRLAI
jgi:hypothetical protein